MTTLPLYKKQPIDYELPWYSFAAIDILSQIINKNTVIFEYGGGGSTVFFAKLAKRVICVESSDAWADKIETVLDNQNITNVEILRHPFDFLDKKSFMQSNFLNCVENFEADIYVIDGYEEGIQLRPYCFERVEKKIKEGNIIVLDDSWRYDSIRNNNKAKMNLICQSVGPCRYGVTSTDVFYY
ncbi:MAG: hypothetical protein CTY16_03045 [Methylobacter sp.]|nr:MAG: hypothetical protein CTY16_03045 [Methylobacter sp.]